MITARGKNAVSVLDLRLQGGDHNRSMGLIIVRGWGRSSGLHPSQASRFIVDGDSGFDQAYLHPRPAALLHPSLHAPRGCGVGLAGFLSICVWCLLPLFCCAAPSGLLVVGIGLWFCASWEIDARSFASFPAIPRPVQPRPYFWYSLLGVPW